MIIDSYRYAIAGGGPPGDDPSFANVVLLAHFDNNLTDFSNSAHTLTAQGSGAGPSAAQSKWGGYSLRTPGSSGGRVDTPYSTDFVFGAGEFTVECWVYIPSSTPPSGDAAFVNFWQGSPLNLSWSFTTNASRNVAFYYRTSGMSTFFPAVGTIPMDQWVHVAACRAGNSLYTCINGTASNWTNEFLGKTLATPSPTTLPLSIGADGSGGQLFNGYIDDVRITKGVGRYTSNFTPPTGPFPDS